MDRVSRPSSSPIRPSTPDVTPAAEVAKAEGASKNASPQGWSGTALTLPARVAKVTAAAQQGVSHYQHLAAAASAGLAKDATKLLGKLGEVKNLTAEELKAVYSAAGSAAARHAAADMLARGVRDIEEIPLVASKALEGGTAAATKVAAETLSASNATKLGKLIGESPAGKAALSDAGKLAFKSGWLGHVVPFLGGAVTAYDAKKAVETLRDPSATVSQKVFGAVTVLADASQFIPVPAVSLLGAAISIPASFLRDNPHPLTALQDMIAGTGQNAHVTP